MSELLTQPTDAALESQANAQDTQESYAGRLRRKLGEAGRGMYSLLDVSAGIALAANDIKQTRSFQENLNQAHNGILERQAAPDVVSMALEADILLDFRLYAQRAGYTDVETMPADMRHAMAETAAHAHMAEIITELQAHHPEWSPEELAEAAATRAADIATLLSLDAAGRDDYHSAMFKYQELNASAAEMQTELEALRGQRRDHLARIGRAALQGLVSFGGKMRDLPTRAASHATTAVLSVGNWYHDTENKKAVKFTALSVALGGVAAYVSMRLSGITHSAPNMTHAAYTTDIPVPAHAPDIPDAIGNPTAPSVPDHLGFTTVSVPDHIGNPANMAPPIPDTIGAPNHVAPPVPDAIGNTAPPIPDVIGNPTGVDLSSATTSEQLFSGFGNVSVWPDTITVSKWDPTDKDGSLWGITTQMLHRSGVANPNDTQVQHLVDALMPQADPNGELNQGQTLNLRPAIDLLPQLS